MTWRSALFWAAALAVVCAVAFSGPMADPIPQDLRYHDFSDQRPFAGIPNFMNVASNLPFLVVGILGFRLVMLPGDTVAAGMKPAWSVFFGGIALTAFGSAYYHLNPANESLIWDRLPMTIGFMSLVAIIVAEYRSRPWGRRLLLPLLFAGLSSVLYWAHTETLGHGDLRPYIVVQFLPMMLIPLVLLLYRERSDLGPYIWWMIGFYIAAKLAELFDAQLFSSGQLVSGHTLKHLIAALAPASLYYGLARRRSQSGIQLQRQPPLR